MAEDKLENGEKDAGFPDKPWHIKGTAAPPPPVATEIQAEQEPEADQEEQEPITLEKPRKIQGGDENGAYLLFMEYIMDYDHILASLSILDLRTKRFRLMNTVILGLLVVFSTYAFATSRNTSYLLMAGICLAFFPILALLPARRRKKTAAEIAGQKGRFRVKIYQDGRIDVPGKGVVPIKSDLRALSYEDDLLLVLDMSARKSFCVPKAYLTSREIEDLRKLLRENSRFQEIKRKEEK